jgi:hypothetical protein
MAEFGLLADDGIYNDAVHLSGLAQAQHSTASEFAFASDLSSRK